MNKTKVSLILKIGLWMLLIGTGPLLLVAIFDPTSNAVGLGILFFITFLPSIILILIGTVKTIWDRRKAKNRLSK